MPRGTDVVRYTHCMTAKCNHLAEADLSTFDILRATGGRDLCGKLHAEVVVHDQNCLANCSSSLPGAG